MGPISNFLTIKTLSLGRPQDLNARPKIIAMNPNGTSQDGSNCCWEKVSKESSKRIHSCRHCGILIFRDQNGARNIKDRG